MSKIQSAQVTPMMKQYFSVKNQYPDDIVFFRMGDFYEMFFDDARIASEELGITLTHRNKMNDDPLTDKRGLVDWLVIGWLVRYQS